MSKATKGAQELAAIIRDSQARKTKPKGEAPKGVEGHIAALESTFREFEERVETRSLEQRRQAARDTIVGYVTSKAEEYPLLTALELESAVVDFIESEAARGVIVTEDDAAKQIESALASKMEKLAQVKPLRALVLEKKDSGEGGKASKEGKEGKKGGSESAKGQGSSSTLDNGLQSESQDSQGEEYEDKETAIARAIEVLRAKQ